jgi:hypothetical protein
MKVCDDGRVYYTDRDSAKPIVIQMIADWIFWTSLIHLWITNMYSTVLSMTFYMAQSTSTLRMNSALWLLALEKDTGNREVLGNVHRCCC